MPDVAHVVHMPSHIYIRTGYYRKGIDVNDHALSGYLKYVNLYQPVTEGAGLYEYHAVHMKMTCAMMADQGLSRESAGLLNISLHFNWCDPPEGPPFEY